MGARVPPPPTASNEEFDAWIEQGRRSRRWLSSLIAFAILAALVAVTLRAQTYPDLGHALYAEGYRSTVWVNSFDPAQPHLAHGVFGPDIPIGATGYDKRFGMWLIGSGSVSVDAGGHIQSAGVAHGPGADGSISIDLLSGGNQIDSAKLPWNCLGGGDCAWAARFQATAGPAVSLRVYRHVEGSLCGGELNIDLNGECYDALVARFHLPAGYRFTDTDALDPQYVQAGGTTALCSLIKPLCSPRVTPPPPPDPCASGCAASCPSRCEGGTFPPTVTPPPPPVPICPAGTSCRAECPSPPSEKICPPEKVCPDPVPCPACPAAVVCPPVVVCPAPIVCADPSVHPPNAACAEYLPTLKALAAGQAVKNGAKVRRAVACVLAHPGATP